jgi:hypothetical protein
LLLCGRAVLVGEEKKNFGSPYLISAANSAGFNNDSHKLPQRFTFTLFARRWIFWVFLVVAAKGW